MKIAARLHCHRQKSNTQFVKCAILKYQEKNEANEQGDKPHRVGVDIYRINARVAGLYLPVAPDREGTAPSTPAALLFHVKQSLTFLR